MGRARSSFKAWRGSSSNLQLGREEVPKGQAASVFPEETSHQAPSHGGQKAHWRI